MTTPRRRPTGLVARLAALALRAARAVAVPFTVAWLDRAAAGAERRSGPRTRHLTPRSGGEGRPVRFLIVNAWGVGGTIRATITTASLLAAGHDVEVVSVLRTVDVPRMSVPGDLRLRPLFDRTDGRRTLGRVPRTLLWRTPSR